jgi:DNA repair exonuclease SbcCD ATPase subunit
MELTLSNFRYHENNTIRLNSGVTLVCGSSGAGKTTILEAIYHALYGKLQKVMHHNAKRCSVTLKLPGNVTIFRQAGPGLIRLTYEGNMYEGTQAQEIINDMFGDFNHFLASSYVKQGERCVLFDGTSEEKLSLIRSISFPDDKSVRIQEKTKSEIKLAEALEQQLLLKVAAQQALLENFKKQNPTMIDGSIDFSQLNVDEMSSQSDSLTQRIAVLKTKHVEVARKEERVKTLHQVHFEDVNVEGIAERVIGFEDQIKAENAKIRAVVEARAIRAAFERVEVARMQRLESLDLKEKEKVGLSIDLNLFTIETIAAEIQRINESKTQERRASEILNRFSVKDINDLRNKASDVARQIRELRGHLTTLTTSLDNIKWNESQKSLLACPKCSTALKFEGGKLCAAEGHVIQVRQVEMPDASEIKIRQKQEEMAKVESERDALSAAQTEYAKFQQNAALTTSKPEDDRLIKCSRLLELTNLIEREKKEVETFNSQTFQPADVSWNEEECKTIIAKLEEERTVMRITLDKYEAKNRHMQQLQEATEALGYEKSELIKADLDECELKLSDVKKKLEDCKKYDTLCELTKKYETERKDADLVNQRLVNLGELKTIAKRVEREIMETTVGLINGAMANILKVLFPSEGKDDSPMVVQFKTEKAAKKGSKVMDRCSTTIYYRNVTYDDPKQLSGGEKDRVSLAMMLALNTMSDSNLILLDETLSTLNQTLKLDIIELLKQMCGKEKTCILIDHNATKGTFDHVIDLDDQL